MVSISSLASVDDGSDVRIEGILVELWKGDDGSETLVLLDPSSQATARVRCARGIAELPTARAGIGDLLLVRGEVAGTALPPALYAKSEDVFVLRPSELALSVTMLADYWPLFEGDRFKIYGQLIADPSSGAARLSDSSGQTSISLHCPGPVEAPPGSRVLVDGRLLVDKCHMYLYIEAESISRAP